MTCPAGWTARTRKFLDYLKPRIPEYHAAPDEQPHLRQADGQYRHPLEGAWLSYGCTGPMLRASLDRTKGDPVWDLRKTEPYSGYEHYAFDVPIPPFAEAPRGTTIGDCWHRFYVRMLEVVQSIRIVEQAIEKYDALHAEGEKVKSEFAAPQTHALRRRRQEGRREARRIDEDEVLAPSRAAAPPAGWRVLRRDGVPSRPDGLSRSRPAVQGECAPASPGAVELLHQPERRGRNLPRLPRRRRAGHRRQHRHRDGGD